MKPPVPSDSVERSGAFELKRLELLRQAARVFAEEGYHQTSVGTLADRLSVSKPVLYYYAQSKDDLLYQIFVASREELDAAINETGGAHLSGMGKVRRFFAKYVELLGGEFGRCFVMVDYRSLEPENREKENKARRGIEEGVRAMLREGQKDGSVRPCDPAMVTRALFATFNGIPQWFHKKGAMKLADVAEAYIDIFVNGVGRG